MNQIFTKMELNYLINIVNDLSNRFENPNVPFEHELRRELLNLGDFEKKIVERKVNSMAYNVGTLHCMKLLKGITTISEYLTNVTSIQEKLQIITEILDDKQHVDCLIDIIDSNLFNDLIDLSIKTYVNDLIHQQNIIENEIIMSLQENLPAEAFTTSILTKFLNHLFHMEFKNTDELIDVFSNQKDWNLEYGSFRVLKNVIQNIMPSYNNVIVKEIKSLIQNDKKVCWFFMLMVIGYIKEEYDGYVELKSKILELITQSHVTCYIFTDLVNGYMSTFIETQNLESLQKSLILARQLYHYTVDKQKLSYQQWLKNNIGDLNYRLKDKSTFSDIIQTLENLVPFENDLDIVKITLSVQISAPSKEYSKVLGYKQLLKSRELSDLDL